MIITRKQAGDTIIEVLIVIMVLGSVLGGAFVTINRSTTNIRQSQERVEASKVAEGQIESLKSSANGGNTAPFTATQPFCMSGGTVVSTFSSGGLPSLDSDALNTYVINCMNSIYKTAIEPDYGGDANTFMVHVRWPKYNAAGNEEVIMSYKVYK